MPLESVESLLKERIAQLDAISERRNALLREMHQMILRRTGEASVLTPEHEGSEDLAAFLNRFRMTPLHTESGSITTLDESELFPPLSLRATVFGGDLPPVADETPNDSDQTMKDTCPPSAHSVSPSSLSQHLDDEPDELDLLREARSSASHFPRQMSNEFEGKVGYGVDSPRHGAEISVSEAPCTIALSQQAPRDRMSVDNAATDIPPVSPSNSANSDGSAIPERPPITTQALDHTRDKATRSNYSNSPTLESRAVQALFVQHPSHPFVPVVATSSKQVAIIPTSSLSVPAPPEFNFSESMFMPPPSITPLASQPRHQFEPNYQIPPLKYVYPDSGRKGKSTKRKRERDRERHDARKDNEWVPLGLNRWAATIIANPVWKKVSRASKCLSTREWAIAMSELRLIRVIDRVEGLKREGHWSFRQPKKQRGVGGLTKSHWDHVMDEMKWMRIDFREERKWKIALAYALSTAVLDWHAACTRDVRLAKGICVRWHISEGGAGDHAETVRPSDPGHLEDETRQHSASLIAADYGSDDGEEETDEGLDPVVDELEPSEMIKQVLNATQIDDTLNMQMKTESDDLLPFASGLSEPTPGDEAQLAADLETSKPSPAELGLKATSNDPILGFKPTPSSTGGDLDQPTTLKCSLKTNVYSPFRQMVIESDESMLFLDFDDFRPARDMVSPAQMQDDTSPLPPDLLTLFPELPTFTLSDVLPVLQSNPEGKKRSEKKSDRDDRHKRSEDITFTRLFPAGDFLLTKPTLLGPLRPSKYWKNGQWLSPEESLSMSDIENPTKSSEERMNELFDSRSSNAPSVLMAVQLQAALLRDKDPRRRNADHLWSTADDILLKSFIDKYPNNWALIAECFNASRHAISTDIRTPRDCLERWKDKCGPEFRRPVDNSATMEDTSPSISSQMTTRGIKRLAGVGVSGSAAIGMPPGNEPRKRRRHILIQETIRKAGKKRAETLQKQIAAQRKPPAIHETHAQYSKMAKRTPAELSRLKAEKEARELQEFQSARKRQEEMNRTNFPRDHPQRLNGNISATPQPQQSANTVQRPIAAIRNQVNISQQQRIGTPSMPGGSRSSPQQLLQVQVRGATQQPPAVTQNPNSNIVLGGNVGTSNGQLSPPYLNRDVASSPGGNGVHLSVNSPRPPSAQAQTRGGYYMPPGYTTEQLQAALRIQQAPQ